MSTKKNQTNTKDEEVDLGKLFESIGRGFNKLFNFIASIFGTLFQFLIILFLFLKKYAIVLGVSIIVGGAIGYFVENGKKPYTSSMIVKPNFNSTRQLYKNIKYFDDLVNQRDTSLIAKIFKINTHQAAQIKSFNIEPIITNNYNLSRYNNFIKKSDSLVVQQITFKEFIRKQTDFDYAYHKISVEAYKNDIFYKLKDGIINSLENNAYLVSLKNNKKENIKLEELLTNNSLIHADSLRKVYNKVLLEEAKKPFSGTNIDMASGKNKTNKELALFNIVDNFKTQLVDINNDKTENRNILNIISNFALIGTKDSIIKRKPGRYAIVLFGLTFLILLLPEMNKVLKKYENK